jgi:hypothetical protein
VNKGQYVPYFNVAVDVVDYVKTEGDCEQNQKLALHRRAQPLQPNGHPQRLPLKLIRTNVMKVQARVI